MHSALEETAARLPRPTRGRRMRRRLGLLTVTLVAVSVTAAAAGVTASAATKPKPKPKPVALALPNSIAAVGDSIARGYNADPGSALTDTPQYSWVTGTPGATSSHYLRVLRKNPAIRDHAYNDALAGTKMSDLAGQLANAAAQQAQYVDVMMGVNDACSSQVADMTPTATFAAQFRNALGSFFKAAPRAHMLVASIPNVGQLWTMFSGRADVVQLWTTFGICAPILSANSSAADRAAAIQRITEYNAVLASTCKLYWQCKSDGNAVFNYHFSAAEVSTVDFFHPSLAGQRSLAAITWAKGWWPTR